MSSATANGPAVTVSTGKSDIRATSLRQTQAPPAPLRAERSQRPNSKLVINRRSRRNISSGESYEHLCCNFLLSWADTRPSSQNPSFNDESGEDSSSASGPTSSYSPHLQPPFTPVEGPEKPLDGLGYLDNQDDNLLGYLRTVRSHLSWTTYFQSLY